MAYRELTMIEVREVLRRWQAGQGVRRIARETGLDRKTVRRYEEAAEKAGAERSSGLSDELVHAVAVQVQTRPVTEASEQMATLMRHRDQIAAWLEADKPLRLTKVGVLLKRQGVEVSYSTLRRFAIDELGWRRRRATVLLSDPPAGQEAQVDFGRMGVMVDPETGRSRKLWALIVTLTRSRYMFVWPTFEQTVEAVVAGLDAAWAFFGGVVSCLVVDNLKPVISKADRLEPVVSEAFLDYAQERGLFVDAARVRHPQDKARVENQVPYVRESWFAGETLDDLDAARCSARDWCRDVAGARVHGTTRRAPREAYEAEEREHMQPPPDAPFDVPLWADAKVQPDHHFQLARALYSVPTRYIGAKVRVRADERIVRVYLAGELIKVHPRKAPGERSTDPADYPTGKAAYAFRSVDELLAQARERGEQIGTYMSRLLTGPLPWTRMRQGYALLRLADRYGTARVEAVCRRALAFDVIDVHRIDRMLRTAVRTEEQAEKRGTLVQLPLGPWRFARPSESFQTRRGAPDQEGSR